MEFFDLVCIIPGAHAKGLSTTKLLALVRPTESVLKIYKVHKIILHNLIPFIGLLKNSKKYVLNFSFLTFPNFSYVVFFHYFSIQLKNIEKMPFLTRFLQKKTRKNSFLTRKMSRMANLKYSLRS